MKTVKMCYILDMKTIKYLIKYYQLKAVVMEYQYFYSLQMMEGGQI